MRKVFLFVGIAAVVAVTIACFHGQDRAMAAKAQAVDAAVACDQLIRLHVVAASDSLEDQRVKLKVRDALLSAFASRWQAENYQDACDNVRESLDEIRQIALDTLRQEGFDYDAGVSFGPADFPQRVYEGICVPAGTYQTLKVALDGGEGRNWWCVMYPALCLEGTDCDQTQQAALPSAENTRTGVVFHSSLWDVIAKWFERSE